MKRIFLSILLLIILFAIPSGIYARQQNAEVKSSELIGTWQRCIKIKNPDNNAFYFRKVNHLKIFEENGNYSILTVNFDQTPSNIWNTGTFRLTSDSTYIEHVNMITGYPSLAGKDVQLKFKTVKSEQGKILAVQYSFEGTNQWTEEFWIKIEKKAVTADNSTTVSAKELKIPVVKFK
jgi:uncharacterized protein YxeA